MLRVSIVAFLASLLAVVVVGCSQASSSLPDSIERPTATTAPADPVPTAAPTQVKPPSKVSPEDALPPVVASVTPNEGTVGSVGPSIVVAGTNFVARSIVQLDGAPLATAFVSGTELRATIPTSKLAVVGALRLSVGTGPPGGGASAETTFHVNNPEAILTSLSPLSVTVGTGVTTLDVKGTGFVSGANVVFGTTELATTFKSTTELEATIPANLLVTSGSVPVKVVNPPPGGGASTPISFSVANPIARISTVQPIAAFVGSEAVPVIIKGSGFVSGSAVLFNGSPLPTTFVSSGELRATLPASSFAAAGDIPITVSNPSPGGGVIAPVAFHVRYPVPQALSLTPPAATVGAAPTDVVVTGSGFFATSEITFDGAPAATTYQDSTHLKATLAASQLDAATKLSVRVVNPAPGGGTSSAVTFTVNNRLPTIVALDPGGVSAGSSDRAITITGTNFVPTTTASSNGAIVMSTYLNDSTITAVIPANHLLNPGTVAIRVTNPSPGGGTSNARHLSVECDTSGVDVPLASVGTTTTLATNFAAALLMARFVEGGSCPAASFSVTPSQPGRFWTVQNNAGVPITLSAWADCAEDGKEGDAYLTFYRRPTVPLNDSERRACTGAISEGIDGGGYASPESGLSPWCPGLTKANGGGLALGVCEKAVVFIQPFSMTSTTFTAPPRVRMRAD